MVASGRFRADYKARIQAKSVTCLNVSQVVSLVMLGEVDAGFVYRSDPYYAGSKVREDRDPRRVPVQSAADVSHREGQGRQNAQSGTALRHVCHEQERPDDPQALGLSSQAGRSDHGRAVSSLARGVVIRRGSELAPPHLRTRRR